MANTPDQIARAAALEAKRRANNPIPVSPIVTPITPTPIATQPIMNAPVSTDTLDL